jgi:hypothetical protein
VSSINSGIYVAAVSALTACVREQQVRRKHTSNALGTSMY